MQKLLLLTRRLVLFLGFLIVATLFLAQRVAPMPPNFVGLIGFEQNSSGKICWHGICPGITTMGQAQAILRSRGKEVSEIESPAGNMLTWKATTSPAYRVITFWLHAAQGPEILEHIIFMFDGSLTMSDTIKMFGAPLATNRDCGLDRHPASFGNRLPFTVYFPNGIYVMAWTSNYRRRLIYPQDARQFTFLIQLSPLMPIDSIGQSDSMLPHPRPYGYNLWRGFGEIESVITPC